MRVERFKAKVEPLSTYVIVETFGTQGKEEALRLNSLNFGEKIPTEGTTRNVLRTLT